MPSQEALLLDCIQRLGRFRQGRRVIQLHLSRLDPDHKRSHHLRIALNTFEEMVKGSEGQIYLLNNADLFFVCRGVAATALQEAVTRVQYLFGDDPLVSGAANDADRFSTWYDVEREYDTLLDAVLTLSDEEAQRQKRASLRGGPADTARPPERLPIDAQHIGVLVDAIVRADLSNVMRRQGVCLIAGSSVPQVIFRELFISIPDLRDTIMPGYDIAGDRALFSYLTRALDRRMLSMLRKNDDSVISSAFSINLNVASVMSEEFLAFDSGLRSGARGTVVIELQYPDIVADIAAFNFAREFVKSRKYRICIDGITEAMLPFIDRERLGADFVKLVWNPALGPAAHGARGTEFRNAIQRFGRARTVLCRCDDTAAIQFGHQVGIAMYQGRIVDRLLGTSGAPQRAPAMAM